MRNEESNTMYMVYVVKKNYIVSVNYLIILRC